MYSQSLLEKLTDADKWQEFLEYKTAKTLNKQQIKRMGKYVNEKKYFEIASKIANGEYTFDYPKKIEVSKMGKSKKRVVYKYKNDEVEILKMLNYLLYEYDYLFADNCYSFRKSSSPQRAIKVLINNRGIKNMYGYKLDISNYFNSIDTIILSKMLQKEIQDELLYNLLKGLLLNTNVYYKGKIIQESEKGIMAGVPVASFLANYYLKEMDHFFSEKGILYARYSDDIIVFAETEELLKSYVKIIEGYLEKYKLKKNSDKESYFNPGRWDFLGFSYNNGEIDMFKNAKDKIKGKIRRSARSIRRWMLKKNVSAEQALKVMTRKFNKKFFYEDEKELNWSRWFFPLINVTTGLNEVDIYLQENLRYIVTGKHNKKNYEKVPYEKLKECEYKSLVNEYYKYRERIE